MTKRFAVLSTLLLATTLATTLATGPARAEEAKPADPSKTENVARDAAPSKTPLPVEQLHLSEQLAAYGRTNKDPLSLIVAAQIRSQVGVKVVDRKPDDADAVGTASAEAGATVDALLSEAKSMAKNDKTIVALADDVKASATKGRVGGGIVSLGQISGRTIHNRTMNFKGGQVAEVAAVGIDSDSVMLEVFDEGGHLICRDHDPAYCRFNPIWTGPFSVKVHNNGSSLAHYRLETN